MASTAAVEWKITVEGTDTFGEVRRQEILIDKSWDRLFDGELGLSVEDGKKIMAALVHNLRSGGSGGPPVASTFCAGRVRARSVRPMMVL